MAYRLWPMAYGLLIIWLRSRDISKRRILIPRHGEIADRDDADRLAVLDDGQPAHVPGLHLLDGVLDGVVRAQDLDVGRSGLAHGGVVGVVVLRQTPDHDV